MSDAMEFKSSSGRRPDLVIEELATSFGPTESDLALAGQMIRADIRKKTAQGMSVDGTPFPPYSTKRPYYYNPSGRGGKFDAGERKKQKAAASRLKKQIVKAGGEAERSRTGMTVKFASYAAFKAAFGRSAVDLQGVSAPHMLDAIVVSVNGREISADPGEAQTMGGAEAGARATEVRVGIYDAEAAARASGHNDGVNKNLPRRRFFGISNDVRVEIRSMLMERIRRRLLKGR